MIYDTKTAKILGIGDIDLKAIHAREYLQSKKSKMDNIKENILKIGWICGTVWFLAVILLGWGILPTWVTETHASEPKNEHLAFLARFPEKTTVIGCYNDRSKTTREATRCTQGGDHNIMLPPRDQIKVWLKYFNEFEIINRLALVNFESSFDENAWNPHAHGYVQTLRSHGVAKDIDTQLAWLSNRQASQKVKYTAGGSKRCGIYWDQDNRVDGFEAWEYGVLSCLYRYHYHAYKGTWYAKRGVTTTKYYKWYMYWIK